MRLLAGVLLAAALAIPCAHAEQQHDPIDDAMNECLAKPTSSSTAGMADCMMTAYNAYDASLEALFQTVIQKLDPDSRDLVRVAQRQWSSFRHAEAAAQAGPWRESRGTIIRLSTLSTDIDLLRQRIAELNLYLPDGG